MSEFDVSKSDAYIVLYSVLVTFTILAVGSAGWCGCLPRSVSCLFSLHTKSNDEVATIDYFLAARNSAGMWSIALSYFASGMGAWVLYGTTEMGATPALSWLGVFGYSMASGFPALIICWLGPKIRERSEKAFSTTDFSRQRYGRLMQLATASVSGFYMFIYIVAELTSISNVFSLLTGETKKRYTIGITLSLGLFTVFYTTLAGLPASIVTDRFQGIIMGILVIMLTIAATTESENDVSREEFDLASNWTSQGFKAAVTLFIAICSAELFNQSTWQRVWAAESVPAMRRGFLLGSVLVFLLMFFFGVMGMIAYANDPQSYDNFEKFAFLAFFDLLAPMKKGWQIMVLILVTALAASSVDSLQNGLTSVFARDLIKIGWNPRWISRGIMVLLNIPAVWLASKQHDVIALFLVADLVCATSVFPVFLGLQTTDIGILVAPTEAGAFLGCVSGIITVLFNGLVNDGELSWHYFWLENDGICALCGSKTMVSFIITPFVSLVMTYFFSAVDVMMRGDAARKPVIPIAFDKEDRDSVTHGEEENGGDVKEEIANEEKEKQDVMAEYPDVEIDEET